MKHGHSPIAVVVVHYLKVGETGREHRLRNDADTTSGNNAAITSIFVNVIVLSFERENANGSCGFIGEFTWIPFRRFYLCIFSRFAWAFCDVINSPPLPGDTQTFHSTSIKPNNFRKDQKAAAVSAVAARINSIYAARLVFVCAFDRLTRAPVHFSFDFRRDQRNLRQPTNAC